MRATYGDGQRPARGTCPNCDDALLNVQGIAACQRCGWSAR